MVTRCLVSQLRSQINAKIRAQRKIPCVLLQVLNIFFHVVNMGNRWHSLLWIPHIHVASIVPASRKNFYCFFITFPLRSSRLRYVMDSNTLSFLHAENLRDIFKYLRTAGFVPVWMFFEMDFLLPCRINYFSRRRKKKKKAGRDSFLVEDKKMCDLSCWQWWTASADRRHTTEYRRCLIYKLNCLLLPIQG